MSLLGLPLIDIIVIILYFVVVIYIGYRAMKRVKNEEDFFLGGRQFGKVIQVFAAFGQGTSAESSVTTTSVVAQKGGAGAWLMMASGLFNVPILWFMARWYRRMRVLTLADFFKERYQSESLAGFYAFIQILFFMVVAGTGFYAMTNTVSAIAQKAPTELTQVEAVEYKQAIELEVLRTADYIDLSQIEQQRLAKLLDIEPQKEFSHINTTYLTIAVAIIILLYAITGGLEAAFITDMIQSIFILLLTIILIPFGWMKINAMHGTSGIMGPFETMHKVLPESLFEMFGSVHSVDFTWYFIASMVFVGSFNVVALANQMTVSGSAKDDTTAQVGMVGGIWLKRYCMLIWALIGMMLLVIYDANVQNPDLIWGMATRDLLGPLGIGLVGLMIACLLAALMSTVDCHMLATSALFTENIYKPLWKNKSQKHYVLVGRLFGCVYIIGGVVIGINASSIMSLFMEILLFNSAVAAAIWLGIVWRKATTTAAWLSVAAAFTIFTVLPYGLPVAMPSLASNPALQLETQSVTVKKSYGYTVKDIATRASEIVQWTADNSAGIAKGQRPEAIIDGDKYLKTTLIAGKAVFWSQGISTVEVDGVQIKQGEGALDVMLIIVASLGFDLEQNSTAMNKTINNILRWIFPFMTLILVSYISKPISVNVLNQFYGKLRTPALADHKQDEQEMFITQQNPTRFDHTKIFPTSNWEFNKWTPSDYKAVGICVAAATSIIVLLQLMMVVGS